VYTAAAHCHLMVTRALVVKSPVHVTGLIPPGKLTGTWNARPLRKVFPARPGSDTVSHPFAVKVVVASVATGLNVTMASGTLSV